jgi:hypothetical protein
VASTNSESGFISELLQGYHNRLRYDYHEKTIVLKRAVLGKLVLRDAATKYRQQALLND